MGIALAGFSLSSAVRVIDRVHDDATNMGTPALPSRASSFANYHIFVVDISYLPDSGHTRRQDLAHLP